MPIPRAAAMRQQAAEKRNDRMASKYENNVNTAQQNQVFASSRPHPNAQFQAQPRFATTNRVVQRRNKAEDYITTKEITEAMEEYQDTGKGFRRFFLIVIAVMLTLLAFSKWDVEMNIEPPQMIDDGSGAPLRFDTDKDGASKEKTENSGAGGTAEVGGAELEDLYDVLGVKGRLQRKKAPAAKPKKTDADDTDSEPAPAVDADKERRRENYRVKQELKKAYENHLEGYGQLVSCGRKCEAKHQQMELAYTTLASQVDRELHGVLFDAKDSRARRGATRGELKDAYAEKKAEIEATEAEGSEDRDMALEELKDAFDILSNPEASAYYHLYNMKPPAMMKKTSARHGGWGQEMMLGTYKYRIINAWLDYLGSSWAEIAILCVLLGLVLSRIPASVNQATQLMDSFEDEGKMNEMDNNRDKNGNPSSPAAASE